MSPRAIGDSTFTEVDPLRTDDSVGTAVARLLEIEIPALPVVDEQERFAGIFGEREFMTALFPGYVGQLKGAAFLRKSLDAALEKRETCRNERIEQHLNRDHVEVDTDYSDIQIAEIFLHHRVLIVPVIEDGRVRGVITRRAFFRTLAERFVSG